VGKEGTMGSMLARGRAVGLEDRRGTAGVSLIHALTLGAGEVRERGPLPKRPFKPEYKRNHLGFSAGLVSAASPHCSTRRNPSVYMCARDLSGQIGEPGKPEIKLHPVPVPNPKGRGILCGRRSLERAANSGTTGWGGGAQARGARSAGGAWCWAHKVLESTRWGLPRIGCGERLLETRAGPPGRGPEGRWRGAVST
jgi:hypothetical protein